MSVDEFVIESKTAGAGDIVVLTLIGDLNTESSQVLSDTIDGQFEKNCFKIIFDMTAVKYISSCCVGVFISAVTRANENGGQIFMVHPADKVKLVFDVFGLTEMFKIVPDVASAVERICSGKRSGCVEKAVKTESQPAS